MPKNRAQKAQLLEAITGALNHKGVVFFSHTGLKVTDLEALRKDMRKENSTVMVAKRNLLLLALKQQGIAVDAAQLDGAVAVAVGDDEITPAKVVATFKKKHEAVAFFGGLMEHRFMTAAEVQQLSTLPGKQELLAKLVGSLQSPMTGMVNVLVGNVRGLVTALDAIRAQKV
ncbi:MAG: 50S ribosomal protein L10 [Patescibacteria group bacterium]